MNTYEVITEDGKTICFRAKPENIKPYYQPTTPIDPPSYQEFESNKKHVVKIEALEYAKICYRTCTIYGKISNVSIKRRYKNQV